MSSKRFVSVAAAFAFGVAVALVPGAPGFADTTTPPGDPTTTESPTETASAGSPDPQPDPTTSAPEPSPSEQPPSTTPDSPSPTQPDPTTSDPASPSPTQPDPTSPSPTAPDPTSPSPSPTAPSPSSPSDTPPPSGSTSPTDPGSSSPPGTPPGAGDPAFPDPGAGPTADPGADLYPQPPFAPVAGNPSAALMQRLYDAQTRQRSLHNQIGTTQDQLAAAEDAVTTAKAALADARATRTRALDGLHESVRTIYKSGAPYGVYTVLDPSADAGVLRAGTHGQLSTVAAASDRVDLLSDRLAAAVDTRDALASELADLRQSLRHADAVVKRLKAQTAAALTVRPPDTGTPAGGAPPVAGPAAGGKLSLPVAGSVTSEYGNRYDPYYRSWQLHAGIDIAAATGTPVRAAAPGRVVQAGWNGGYGNYICLAHGQVRGQQLTTCYGHLSRILVTEGATVPAGHTIGQVGSTGASTGPHLHFEVRVGGRPTDPRLWF